MNLEPAIFRLGLEVQRPGQSGPDCLHLETYKAISNGPPHIGPQIGPIWSICDVHRQAQGHCLICGGSALNRLAQNNSTKK
jgi:hypothetical protein